MDDARKVAIPTEGTGGLDSKRSAHFGHADSFTVVEIADGAVVGTDVVVNPPHSHGGCGQTVAMLAGAGVDVAIVVGMGGGPLAAMKSHGMIPLFDDQSPTPREAVEAYLRGELAGFDGRHTCKGH